MDFVLSANSSFIYWHCNITIFISFLNLEWVLDVFYLTDSFQPGPFLKRGVAMITKAGTDQQTFICVRFSRSGVQFILQSLILKFNSLKWKSEEVDNQGDSNDGSSLDAQAWRNSSMADESLMPETGPMQFPNFCLFQ